MKVREVREVFEGLGGKHLQARVFEVPEDEEAPEGAQIVPDETPACDWQPVTGE